MTVGEQSTAHPSTDELLDYFEAKLSDEPERLMEEHLARCAACTAAAREVYSFHEVWTGWTAQAHGDAYLRGTLAAALGDVEARVTNPAWRERLQRWRVRWAGAAEAGLRVAMQVTEQATRVVAEGLEGLTRPGSVWQFAPAYQAVPIRGAGPEAQSSAVLTTAITPGKPRARVAVRGGETSEIVVRVDDVEPGAAAPLVVLVATGPGGAAATRVTEVERQPATGYFIARFEDVPPGEYVVAFEPLEVGEERVS